MPAANQRISEYVLDEKIGGGTFGEVWRAHHHVWTDQNVAIKIPTDPSYVRNLQREGVAIHGLQHPNIVRAIGFDPYADPPYLTMEFVPGTSLRPLIQSRKLMPLDAVSVMKQVLAGLAYAHKQGVVHRDVKPENILVSQDGINSPGGVKVTDFGLGRATQTTMGSIMYSQDFSREGNQIAGTLDYMAPEQRGGGEVDGRADLYACGVMLYEMLTGERPAGTDVPSDLNPQSPKYLDEVFKHSYARLDKRYASADDFLKALSYTAPSPVRGAYGMPPLPPVVPPPLYPHGMADNFASPIMHGGKLVCPKCRQPVDRNDQFCMHCGIQMTPNVRRCRKCGAYPDPSDRFCIFCGDSLAPAQNVQV